MSDSNDMKQEYDFTGVERTAEDGYRTVNLEGRSDVGFLVEHACSAAGLEYRA